MQKVKTLLITALLILNFSAAYAVDEITLTYRKAETRYGHGEGYLTSSQTGDFAFNRGDSIPFAYTGAVLKGREKNRIILSGGAFNYAFLAPRPTGHGYYTVSFSLPETEKPKIIEIRLEDGEKLVRTNIDFEVDKEGDFLVLRGETGLNHIEFSIVTELMSMILSSLIAAFIFGFVLLVFIMFRRKEIKTNLKRYLSMASQKSKPFISINEEKNGYKMDFISPMKVLRGFFSRDQDKISLKIPHWFVSLVILIFLILVFLNSITAPLERVWPRLGSLKIVFVLAAFTLSILSVFFLLSARDYKELITRLAVIGAAIVGVTFANLGLITIFLAFTTGSLIYLLSILITTEEDD
ncbi:MAG: hypothetical protein ACW99F_15050 [Candidatus Hodarchaeales archaeon]